MGAFIHYVLLLPYGLITCNSFPLKMHNWVPTLFYPRHVKNNGHNPVKPTAPLQCNPERSSQFPKSQKKTV